jgi:hypothetical protein
LKETPPRRMARYKDKTANTARGEKTMGKAKGQEENYKNDDVNKAQDGFCKLLSEIRLAVQEWGLKNNLRLFGIDIFDVESPMDCNERIDMAKAYFTDTVFKSMIILFFDTNEKNGKVTVTRSKIGLYKNGYKWPIKFARTKEFESDHIDPIGPLYWVLVDREIILPFKSMLKKREWLTLPFEDMPGIKSTDI